ncbi:MAG: ShlB/FhaC/HecB family hemolysin secretion/activation protein [Anaerohalosphaera sp.]|nr:ShlB/FhaC/HecB family hemolysin secretion/activation protein [Anaerohalosphaera sp.]
MVTKTRSELVSLSCAFVIFVGVLSAFMLVGDVAYGEDEQAMKDIRDAADKAKRESDAGAAEVDSGENLKLPVDNSTVFAVSSVEITGNTLLTKEQLLGRLPDIYTTSDKSVKKAESDSLFDMRTLKDIINFPGEKRNVSARTISGFTQYLVARYTSKGYSGIYAYVPASTFDGETSLQNDVLTLDIIEVKVSRVDSSYYNVSGQASEKPYLRQDLLEKWSPAEPNMPLRGRKVDEFINLLNQNPDRYISAKVSKGEEADTLAVDYNIYEISPWHWFAHVDNAGTKDRRWAPRFGVINTNVTGRDDKFIGVIHAPVDDRLSKDDYSIFASYDVPVWGPKLRFTVFGGRSEFEVNGGNNIEFLGNGYVYGGTLKYNAVQHKGWFGDVYATLSREKSKVTSSLFAQRLGSKVYIDMFTIGTEVHRSNDMSKTSFDINRGERIGGSGQRYYKAARNNAKSDFAIWTFSADHQQYLKSDKVERVQMSAKYIRPNERLVPAKMTTFGGMYSVRGYNESIIVADGGVLASLQYEYDLVKKNQLVNPDYKLSQNRKPLFKKIAPVAFFDYGRADTKDSVAGEYDEQELYSVGGGIVWEKNDNVSGGVYYGYPLKDLKNSDKGDGRLNVYFALRW